MPTRTLTILVFLLPGLYVATAQKRLTIEECYTLAERNYPLIKQRDLISQATQYAVENAARGWLPQLNIQGQATYQSDVTSIPIKLPGQDIPTPSKDQYKLYAEVTQVLYDGGNIRLQQQSAQAGEQVELQKTAVALYQLKERINQLFFGILLLNEQLRQNELRKSDIQLGLNKAQTAVDNGTALKSSADLLKAEIIQTDQHAIELVSARKAYTSMLALFTGTGTDSLELVMPQNTVTATGVGGIHRPELLLYQEQDKSLDVQRKILSARNRPKLNLFVQGGLGRPALNLLSNDFAGYYIGGLRLSFPLGGLYTLKNDRETINVSRKNIGVQRDVFLFNTSLAVQQQQEESNKQQQLLSSDDEIIRLRTSVKNAALLQLENGVITNDYLKEVNAADNASQNKILHRVQWLLTQYNLQTTTGN